MDQPGGWDYQCQKIRERAHRAELDRRTAGFDKIFLSCSCGGFPLVEILLSGGRYNPQNYSFIERYLPLEFALHLHREHAHEENEKAARAAAVENDIDEATGRLLQALGFPMGIKPPTAQELFDADPFKPMVSE